MPVKFLIVYVGHGRRTAVIEFHAIDCEVALFFREKFRMRRGMGQEENRHNAEEKRDSALDEKYKRPSVIPLCFYLREARSEETSKGTGERRSAVEESNPSHELVTTVEHGEVDDYSAEETAFHETEEKSRDEQGFPGGDKSDAEAYEAPAYDEGGEVVACAYAFDKPV